MKRSALTFLLAFICLPCFAQESGAPQRIDVKPRGPAAIVNGRVQDRKEVVYLFKAKAGQKFTGRITRQSGDASFAVTDPDGEALPEEEFDVNTKLTGSLTKTGDYKIAVNTVNTANSKYTLAVKVY